MLDIKANGFIDRLNKEGVNGITYVLKADGIAIVGIKTLEQLNSAREFILYFIQIRDMGIKYKNGKHDCLVKINEITESEVISRICKPAVVFTERSAGVDPEREIIIKSRDELLSVYFRRQPLLSLLGDLEYYNNGFEEYIRIKK